MFSPYMQDLNVRRHGRVEQDAGGTFNVSNLISVISLQSKCKNII